ncbi:hypothetical protein Acy02nite_28120 [Actinoplanes cyaneus]|uniref:Aminoglycoside phosphotransferase domain-containing protein n=1 Tax=Actinoplanes cyaneus TaxID=52696 RepID=A0A919II94_9ACTN|nr:aminoglycoside phosphotransferase family protein [Actinoplanes cyaneus]MCW2137862.1 Phosphotransferase enzyme family protein [Actinoplanes cyaneus]GID64931.1 hypothetical protein Acy02nite_28120 [Actinoplanes cyaneus]
MLQPRYRPGASRRPFVDREQALGAFQAILDQVGAADPATAVPAPVLTITGVGGIGKSRLLTEFGNRATGAHPQATLDLQIPSLGQQENALATLRAQFGAAGIDFPRFDIAYAVWWQRLHPNLRISKDGLALVEHSAILTEVLDQASGVPVFGASMRLVEWATRRVKKWRWMRTDEAIRELDTLTLTELADAVTYLFATELAQGGRARAPFLLFIDAYEALAGGAERLGNVTARDGWLRDLLGQLRHGVVVVAAREPLQWHRHHPDWGWRIHREHIEDLPMQHRMTLLEDSGVADVTARRVIAQASAGVPFYLHLAIDSGDPVGATPESVPVSTDTILERFCAHVDPAHVRLLELINVARVFDEKIFRRIAEEYGLPGHRLMWQSLTDYSFVSATGERHQLHQLMVHALRRRLDPAVTRDLHRLLHQVWDDRAVAASSSAETAAALREAAFHGMRAGSLAAIDLLRYADRILARGVQSEADGLRTDIQEHLATAEDTDSEQLNALVRLLSAEIALLRGDAATAGQATGEIPEQYDTEINARLAVAAAQADRILGNTARALGIYESVWRDATGQAASTAGLWAADLHMCQGRAAKAIGLVTELQRRTPAEDHELHGHLARLLALTYQFDFDYGPAAEHIARAHEHYRLAGSDVGVADVATNRTEILAHADPAAARVTAVEATRLQRVLGAVHELGKISTATAIACLRIGDLGAAHQALDEAGGYLESSGYRSGRARAELVRAFVFAREGRFTDAAGAATTAVQELRAVEVYPTLVLVAEFLLDWIDRPSPIVSEAARQARSALRADDRWERLEERIAAVGTGLLGAGEVPPDVLYRMALERGGESGYYNRNVGVAVPAGRRLVRIPLHGADDMDLRIWHEADVLAGIHDRVSGAPLLHFRTERPAFQIHEFIEGDLLDRAAPRGRPVPPGVLDDVVRLFGELSAVPREVMPPLPDGWPQDGDCPGFFDRLIEVTRRVHVRHHDVYRQLFREFGFPEDPLDQLTSGVPTLTGRGFTLLHCDVHRKNVIVSPTGCRFIDWELALWGDPVYDLASHLHKMGYLSAEEARLTALWAGVLGPANPTWQEDLGTYLAHERVKSAIVDTVRYAQAVASGAYSPEWVDDAIAKLVGKLDAAYAVWGDFRHADPAAVRRALGG